MSGLIENKNKIKNISNIIFDDRKKIKNTFKNTYDDLMKMSYENKFFGLKH